MIVIHEPEVTRSEGRVRVSALIEGTEPQIPSGGRLWYEVDDEFADGVTARADAFALLGSTVGMRLSRDVEIRGPVSPLLLNGIFEYQRILRSWFGAKFRIIDVRAESPEPTPAPSAPGAVGACFSGGVDSFHTLFRRAVHEPIESMRLTHAMIVNGFDYDIDLEEQGHARAIRKIYEPVLKDLNVMLVEVRSNMMSFSRGIPLMNFGSQLAASALALGGMFRLFYLPGSYSYEKLVQDGSHPMTDHLFGTESLHVVHDGGSATRFERIQAIVDRQETYSTLRVCRATDWRNIDVDGEAVANCGRCSKCIRTMVSLKLLGALDRYRTFVRPLERRANRRAHCRGPSRVFAAENLRAAIEKGDRETAFDLRWQIARGWILEAFDGLGNRLRARTRRGPRHRR